MEVLQRFLDYLTNQKIPASPITVKNYKADIRKFINWYQTEFQKPFCPPEVTLQIINLYKQQKVSNPLESEKLSVRTVERHLSSLRKFFAFLALQQEISESPFLTQTEKQKEVIDPWRLKEFKNFLYNNQSSRLTIKNYILDIQHFLKWVENVTKPINEWEINQTSVFENISTRLIEEYKKRLLEAANFSPSSINRKLSAIRKFAFWAKQENLIPEEKATLLPSNYTISQASTPTTRPSIFPKPSPLLYTPLYASSISKTMWYKMRYLRPKWYHRYHTHPLTSYFHFVILLLCISAVAFGFYTDFLTIPNQEKAVQAVGVSPPRVLSFQGKLNDKNNAPITSPRQMRFSIYNSPTASGAGFLWQEVDTVKPNNDGVFYTLLGNTTPIPQTLFAQNPNLYLGIAVGDDAELLPRQQLATVGYAANAETLQGLSPITQAGAGEKNVILALDSSGNLTIGGVASPTFQATGGSLKLSGQQLLLNTNTGSSGDIQLNPDGTGKVDIQKPIINSGSSGTLSPGAVEVLDQFVVFATESARAAFILNNNSTSGDIFTASSAGITRFIVDNGGKVGIGGISKPATALQVAGAITPASDGDSSVGTSSLAWGTIYAKNVSLPSSGGIGGYVSLTAGVLSPTNVTNDLAIGGTTTSSAKFSVVSSNGNITTAGTITGVFSTSSYTERLCWSGSGASLISDCSGSPGDYAEQYGTFDSSIEAGDVVVIDASHSAVPFEKNGEKSSKAWIVKSSKPYENSLLGIVSTNPNEVIGKVFEPSENPRPIALNGRVPIKVSLENGPIAIGDYLTSSSTPGVAMKATKAGSVIGKALEPYSSCHPEHILCHAELDSASQCRLVSESTKVDSGSQAGMTSCVGKVLAFVHTSWYDPIAYITEAGNLSIVANNPNIPNSPNLPSEIRNSKFEIRNLAGESFSRISAFSQLLVANLTAGLIEAKAVTTDALLATNAQIDQITSKDIVSPIVEANLLKTDIITPLSSGNIMVSLNTPASTFQIINASGSAVAAIDSGGNATFSGTLTAHNLEGDEASISGTLRANKIIANNIEGLEATDFGRFNLGLVALGGTSLQDVSVSNSLNIQRTLILADNSISVLGSDLELQPFRQGGISILSGLIHIDIDGNLTAQGANFAKNVSVNGSLSAGVISPLPDSDVVVRLSDSPVHSSQFTVHGASDSAVLTIDNKGNITASESGTFKNIYTNGFNIVRQAQADTTLTQTVASGSAGTATIIQGELERTIIDGYVKETSLIYITPTSDTQGVTPYVARQNSGSFSIQIPQVVYKDIKLNWWIVN